MMAPVDDPATPSPPPVAVGGQSLERGWAVPGSAEGQPPPPPPPGAPGGDGRAPADRLDAGGFGGRWSARGAGSGPSGDVPNVALRPMTVADVLDGGFAVVKARPARIMAITAIFVVPTHLLTAYLQRDASGGIGVGDIVSQDPTVLNEQVDQGNQVVAVLMGILIPAVALVYVAAAIAHLVSQWVMGRDAPAGEMLRVAGRRSWALLGSFVIVKLAEIASVLACYIGLLFMMPLFVAVAPVIGVEGGGPGAAVARSVRLVRSRYFPVMGVAVLMGIVAALLGNALAALPQGLAAWIGYDDGWPLLALGSILSQVVVLPFVAAATVLLYFDLRVRTEGLDLEMAAVDLFDRTS
jgi:hypothetical protein